MPSEPYGVTLWEGAEVHAPTEEEFREVLTLVLREELNRKPERVFQFLYRVDVDEAKTRKALLEPDPPKALAGLIVDRLIMTWHIRQSYKRKE
jgi:hypothetical protein